MAASSLFGGKHATFWINQRYFSPSKVCGFHRIGVRHAPFGCAPYSVLLCDMRRFMQFRWIVITIQLGTKMRRAGEKVINCNF
jgi:hypothetical protein